MQRAPQPSSSSSGAVSIDLAAELDGVLKQLKDARKILARDWEQMTPRERSAASRLVKQLEQREHTLLEEIQMSGLD